MAGAPVIRSGTTVLSVPVGSVLRPVVKIMKGAEHVPNVAVHQVGEQRLAGALDDIDGRAYKRWHSLRYDSISPALIRAMADELLDHVAARMVTEPGLDTAARTVAVTAAECVHGVLSVMCFPNGDQELRFPPSSGSGSAPTRTTTSSATGPSPSGTSSRRRPPRGRGSTRSRCASSAGTCGLAARHRPPAPRRLRARHT